MMRDQHRDELDEKRYFMETQRYRDWNFPPVTVEEYEFSGVSVVAQDRVRRVPISGSALNSAAEAAVGYSLT